jgi:hypothetical protein
MPQPYIDVTGATAYREATGEGSFSDPYIPRFTANAGTNLNTSALALESGGNLAGINAKLPTSLGAKAPSASLSVTQAFAATSTLTSVASSATSVTLLAANNNRKVLIILNVQQITLYF